VIRRVPCLVLLAAIGVAAFAYDSSVTVDARWRVLPYQSIAVVGTSQDPASLWLAPFASPDLTPAGGYVVAESAVQLRVTSNVAWKLQLRLADAWTAPGLEARRGGSAFAPLSDVPLVLASGSHGVYEIVVDLRRPEDAGDAAAPIQLVATLMPE